MDFWDACDAVLPWLALGGLVLWSVKACWKSLQKPSQVVECQQCKFLSNTWMCEACLWVNTLPASKQDHILAACEAAHRERLE